MQGKVKKNLGQKSKMLSPNSQNRVLILVNLMLA